MNWTGLIFVAATLLFISKANAGSDVVLIDHSERAYTVYAGLPSDRAEAAKSKLEGKPVDMLPFDQFAANHEQIIGSRVVRNDYQDDKTGEGVVALVRKYPGTPFGVTWNGGIAYTRSDYLVAKKSFESFNGPGGYTKPPPENDPVAPPSHLKPLLGW